MAIVYVTDFTSQGTDVNSRQQSSAAVPFNQTQIINTTTTSTATTNPVSPLSTLVRVHNDSAQAINFVFGVTPTATANVSPRMAANQTEYFTVPLSSNLKFACINATV